MQLFERFSKKQLAIFLIIGLLVFGFVVNFLVSQFTGTPEECKGPEGYSYCTDGE